MKKIILFLALIPTWVFAQERIMVIADPHVFAPSLHDDGAAFQNMMASQRKMLHLSQDAWDDLVHQALDIRPELVLIPGDLTKDGEIPSHTIVANDLQKLNNVGIKTLVIPGNHDIGGTAYSYFGEEATTVQTLTNAQWWEVYESVCSGIIAKDENSHSFAAEPLAGLTVIGIDGAHNNAGTGSLSDATLAWILAQADAAKEKGHMIIAMCHWQLVDHFDKQSSVESSCQLKNAEAIRNSLMQHGVHLVLTGHFHVNGITTVRNESDSIIEVTTGSPITFPCPYRWLTISKDRKNVQINTAYIPSLPAITDVDLYDYSREWMATQAHQMIPAMSLKIWNRADEAKQKVEDFMGAEIANRLIACIPQTDEEKIALVEKYLGSTVVDLYLLHSEANEPEHPEAESLAQALYDGMDAMMTEVLKKDLILSYAVLPTLKLFAHSLAQEPVQSLVEDVTNWAKQKEGLADRTDDLQLSLTIGDGYTQTGLDDVEGELNARKSLQNGILVIEHNGRLFNAQGVELK